MDHLRAVDRLTYAEQNGRAFGRRVGPFAGGPKVSHPIVHEVIAGLEFGTHQEGVSLGSTKFY